MFTENWGLIAFSGVASLVASILYMLGGTVGFTKALRRYGATFFLAVMSNINAIVMGVWSWQFILIYPALIGGFSLGYGASTTGEKILKRTIFALGSLSAIIFGLWGLGFPVMGWLVLGLAILIGLTSVVMGVFNPFNNAPLEQYLICQVLTLFIPFISFISK